MKITKIIKDRNLYEFETDGGGKFSIIVGDDFVEIEQVTSKLDPIKFIREEKTGIVKFSIKIAINMAKKYNKNYIKMNILSSKSKKTIDRLTHKNNPMNIDLKIPISNFII